MSEKRKPQIKIVALKLGKDGKYKRNKMELFGAWLWPEKSVDIVDRRVRKSRYRVRFNGKFVGGIPLSLFTLSEALNHLREYLARKPKP